MSSDLAYVDAFGLIRVPDTKVKTLPEHDLRPCRGYSSSVAVFDINDKCIGWADVTDLGYPDVKSWMTGTKYTVRG